MSETDPTGFLLRIRKHSHKIAALLLFCLVPMFGGCYGYFPLTRALYKWNGKVTDNEIIHNVVFWLLAFFWIYGFAAIGDAVIFNLVEFWTGTKLDVSKEFKEGDTTVALKPTANDDEIVMTVTRKGQVISERRFVRTSKGECEIRDAQGKVTGKVVKGEKGSMKLLNADGRVMQNIPAEMNPQRGQI